MSGVFWRLRRSPLRFLTEMLNIRYWSRRLSERRAGWPAPIRVEAVNRFSYRGSANDSIGSTNRYCASASLRLGFPYPAARFGASYLSPTESRIKMPWKMCLRMRLGPTSAAGRTGPFIAARWFSAGNRSGICRRASRYCAADLAITGPARSDSGRRGSEYALPGGPLGNLPLQSIFSGDMRKVAAQLDGRRRRLGWLILNPGSDPECVELFDAIWTRASKCTGVVWSARKKSCGSP